MPAVIVYTCASGGSDAAVPLGTARYPTCPNGEGAWQAITVDEPLSQSVDWDVVVWAAGSGVAMWAVGIGIGLIIGVLRKGRI